MCRSGRYVLSPPRRCATVCSGMLSKHSRVIVQKRTLASGNCSPYSKNPWLFKARSLPFKPLLNVNRRRGPGNSDESVRTQESKMSESGLSVTSLCKGPWLAVGSVAGPGAGPKSPSRWRSVLPLSLMGPCHRKGPPNYSSGPPHVSTAERQIQLGFVILSIVQQVHQTILMILCLLTHVAEC